jgi:hypothetical protein
MSGVGHLSTCPAAVGAELCECGSTSTRTEHEARKPELRLRKWRAYQNIVEIQHTRDISPVMSEASRINRAVTAYVHVLDGKDAPVIATLGKIVEGLWDMRRRKVIDEENDDQWLNAVLKEAGLLLKLAKAGGA